MMKTTDYILHPIDRLPIGYVFTYTDFINELKKKEAIIKALNRLAATGKLIKLSKGRFYKPETSAFGTLQPQQYQIVKETKNSPNSAIGYCQC